MNIKDILEQKLAEVILNVQQLKDIKLEIQENKTEFEGDFTIVTFPLVKQLKKNPETIGTELGKALTEQTELLESFNVVKGFLNIKVKLYLNINKNSYNCLKFKQTNYKPINFLGVNVC